MARIQNENLSFVNLPGNKWGAVVTYEILWEPGDVSPHFNSVALVGDDPVFNDKLAAMSANPGWLPPGVPFTVTPVIAANVIEEAGLDEDRDINLLIVRLRRRDEVFARISVSPVVGDPVTATTNRVEMNFGP
jgi:hypothetical protein